MLKEQMQLVLGLLYSFGDEIFPTIVSILCKARRSSTMNLEGCSDGRIDVAVLRGDEVEIRRWGGFLNWHEEPDDWCWSLHHKKFKMELILLQSISQRGYTWTSFQRAAQSCKMWEHHLIFVGMGVKGLVLIHLDCRFDGPNMVNPPFKQTLPNCNIPCSSFRLGMLMYSRTLAFPVSVAISRHLTFIPTPYMKRQTVNFTSITMPHLRAKISTFLQSPTLESVAPSQRSQERSFSTNHLINTMRKQFYSHWPPNWQCLSLFHMMKHSPHSRIIPICSKFSDYLISFLTNIYSYSCAGVLILFGGHFISTLSNSYWEKILMMCTLVPEGRLNSTRCETGHNTLISSHSKRGLGSRPP
ncbi:hypothetical protein VP01_4104g2 [Puccinia sorghi]|uniref:Uncharacterized protein n=1 Tax=Puccinia sorghi TaxID=27349 RepID=A0A0L6URA4_9BASI|nr:hypothetical protein VP01_4104g2 [Puccinia sorghi]